MSNTLAIGVVSTTLRSMLLRARSPLPHIDPPVDPKLNDLEVTLRPLDQARNGVTKTQLNLFLYAVRPNAAFSNMDPPRTRPGETAQPALALDLQYLLSAWGKEDADELAHRALGWAMAQFHDQAVLLPSTIQAALNKGDLHQQVERVRLTPLNLSLEDMSKLWTMSQSSFRASVAYQASLVLIDGVRRTSAPLPVLFVQPGANPELTPPVPTIVAWSVASGAPATHLGDTITVTGYHLDGPNVTAYFSTPLSPTPLKIPAIAGSNSFEARFSIPSNKPDDWPAGPWQLAISPTGDAEGITNQLAFQMAPEIQDIQPPAATVDANGDVTLAIDFVASVWPDQQVSLILGSRLVRTPARTAKVTQIAFLVPKAPLGDHFVRVRVDGIDSLLITYPTLAFDLLQKVKIQ